MGKVELEINKRRYGVGCEDGQEDHIKALGRHVDTHVRQLSRSLGEIGEPRLLLMAALMITDELHEARMLIEQLNRAQTAPPAAPLQPVGDDPANQAQIARAIDLFEHATVRLEKLRRTIEGK